MAYLVTLAMQDGGKDATVEVFATNKGDAEYRAAVKVENTWGRPVSHVKACRRT